MTTVTIHDEATRRVLVSAACRRARSILDPTDMGEIGTVLNDAADAIVGFSLAGSFEDVLQEIDQSISALAAVRETMEAVQAAGVGEAVEVALSTGDLLYGADSTKEGIEDYDSNFVDGGFWNQTPEVREALIASRDAAVRLMAELKPAEAVA